MWKKCLIECVSPNPLLGRKARGDVAMDDAWGKEGKGALCRACWDLRPNRERLIAGKSSFWQAALQCMLEPANASHPLPLLTHTVHGHAHTHTSARARKHKLKSRCTERGLIIWQGWGVRSHFQSQCVQAKNHLQEARERRSFRAIITNARCLDETGGGLEDYQTSLTWVWMDLLYVETVWLCLLFPSSPGFSSLFVSSLLFPFSSSSLTWWPILCRHKPNLPQLFHWQFKKGGFHEKCLMQKTFLVISQSTACHPLLVGGRGVGMVGG